MTNNDIEPDTMLPQRRIGYVRVTSVDNDRDTQNSAMTKAGCYCVFEDVNVSSKKKCLGLTAVLESLEPGDTLVVWRLDHLDMTARQFVLLLDRFKQSNINIISIQDNVDTTTSVGKSMLHISAVMAQMERRVINERDIQLVTASDLPRGRPTVLSDAVLDDIERLAADPTLSTIDVAKRVGISRATVYRALNVLRAKAEIASSGAGRPRTQCESHQA